MKKIVTLMIMMCFIVTTAMPSYAGHGRSRSYRHTAYYPPVHARYVHNYRVSYDYDWAGAALVFGAGAIAGALVGSFCGPQPNSVVYAQPAPVVVTPAPTVVVQQPVTVVQPSYGTAGSVSVTASVLNVRSGPGGDHAVIAQVYQGNILTILGAAHDWLYVKLPSGGSGWVMAQYTAAVSPPACG